MGVVKYLEQKKILYRYMNQGELAKYAPVVYTGPFSGLFSVCNGLTKLIFFQINNFNEIKLNVEQNNYLQKIQPYAWIVGAGVHNMVEAQNSIQGITDFSQFLNAQARLGLGSTRVIYMGTHFRIVKKTPKPYLEHAKLLQGNEKIQLWNKIMSTNAVYYMAINPFAFTKSVVGNVDWYRDTEDGFHMGYWVNHEKVQMVVDVLFSFNISRIVKEKLERIRKQERSNVVSIVNSTESSNNKTDN